MSKSQNSKTVVKNATASNKIDNAVETVATNETLPTTTEVKAVEAAEKVSTQAVSLITASNLPTLTDAKKALNETAKITLTGFFSFFQLYKKSLFRLARINEAQIKSVDASLTAAEKAAAQSEAVELTNKLSILDKEFKTFLQLNSSKLNMSKVHDIFTSTDGNKTLLLVSDTIEKERFDLRTKNESDGKKYDNPYKPFNKDGGWSNNRFLMCLIRAAKKDKVA